MVEIKKFLTVDELTDKVVNAAIACGLVDANAMLANASIYEISIDEAYLNAINQKLKDFYKFLDAIQ